MDSADGSTSAYDLFQTGCRFLRERHPGQAVLYLERALVFEPGRSSIHEALGRAYYALCQFDRAAAAFTRVVRLYPTNDYAQFARSRSLLASGEPAEALVAARLALALNPSSADYRHAVDDCLRAIGERRRW